MYILTTLYCEYAQPRFPPDERGGAIPFSSFGGVCMRGSAFGTLAAWYVSFRVVTIARVQITAGGPRGARITTVV